MFNPAIQNYINSSGEAAALTRARQLESYINSIYEQKKTEQEPEKAEFGSTPFNQVLKTTVEENTAQKSVFDIDKPPVIPFGTLSVGSKIKTEKISQENNQIKNAENITKNEIMSIIDNACEKYNMDSKLVAAVIKQESGFKADAKSSAGALGLMQLMPQTAEALGVNNPMDPIQNVEGGVRYLKQMLDKYNGNKILALAAYNAGPNAVAKYGGVPPYKETQNYVRSILNNYL